MCIAYNAHCIYTASSLVAAAPTCVPVTLECMTCEDRPGNATSSLLSASSFHSHAVLATSRYCCCWPRAQFDSMRYSKATSQPLSIYFGRCVFSSLSKCAADIVYCCWLPFPVDHRTVSPFTPHDACFVVDFSALCQLNGMQFDHCLSSCSMRSFYPLDGSDDDAARIASPIYHTMAIRAKRRLAKSQHRV